MVLVHNQYTCVKRMYVVYVEGTLYTSIFLLEIERKIILTGKCKDSPTIEKQA
jgi:hypothetical protein